MNKKKKIGVIGAMEEEVEALRVKLENPEKLTKASMDFYSPFDQLCLFQNTKLMRYRRL